MRRALLVLALGAACHAAAPAPPPAPSAGLPVGSPESLGFDSLRLDSVVTYLRSQVDSSFPGAVVAVGRHGRLALLAAVGHYAQNDARPMATSTIFDLASLTKVIALTTECILLVDQGKLDLDAPVQRYVPEFRGPMKDQVLIRHLLTHSAGLVADLPLFDSTKTRAQALAMVDTSPLVTPPGTNYVYSDLSAIVLMQVVERITGRSFDQVVADDVFTPLGMTATRFNPPKSWHSLIAPTEVDTFFRHRLLIGEVHDESAARLGGVSGNAGLFSNAADLARFAAWLLAYRTLDPAKCDGVDMRLCVTPVPSPTVSHPVAFASRVKQFTTKQDLPPGSSRALGWDTPSPPSSAGSNPPPDGFGHTGYTGTSIWLFPSQDMFIILLTNRVNPTRNNVRILRVRPRVADLVFAAIR